MWSSEQKRQRGNGAWDVWACCVRKCIWRASWVLYQAEALSIVSAERDGIQRRMAGGSKQVDDVGKECVVACACTA